MRILLLELAPDPFYGRADVGPEAVLAVATDEATVTHLVIDGPVADIVADVRQVGERRGILRP